MSFWQTKELRLISFIYVTNSLHINILVFIFLLYWIFKKKCILLSHIFSAFFIASWFSLFFLKSLFNLMIKSPNSFLSTCVKTLANPYRIHFGVKIKLVIQHFLKRACKLHASLPFIE